MQKHRKIKIRKNKTGILIQKDIRYFFNRDYSLQIYIYQCVNVRINKCLEQIRNSKTGMELFGNFSPTDHSRTS